MPEFCCKKRPLHLWLVYCFKLTRFYCKFVAVKQEFFKYITVNCNIDLYLCSCSCLILLCPLKSKLNLVSDSKFQVCWICKRSIICKRSKIINKICPSNRKGQTFKGIVNFVTFAVVSFWLKIVKYGIEIYFTCECG